MIEKRNIQDAYKYYKLKPEVKNPVGLATYRAIVNGFVKFIVSKLFDGFDVEFSVGSTLGILGIRGKKPKVKITEEGHIKGLCPDWGATRKAWANNPAMKEAKQVVYHTNEHSNGVRYKFTWYKSSAKLTNKGFYSFVASRKNKRTLPIMINSGREYLVMD